MTAERDRQTDGQTDRTAVSIWRVSIAAIILIFDKCLSPRQTTANNCKTAFSLHVVESASDDYNF